MEPVVCVERGHRCSRIIRVVVGKLGHGQEASPVGLLVLAIHVKVLLQYGIQPLRLAICLGMEGGRPVGMDPQKLQESPPKVRCEDGVLLGRYRERAS